MEKSYYLRVITPEDVPKVIDFLSRFFFRDEPLNIETGMDLDYINGTVDIQWDFFLSLNEEAA